MKSKAGRKKKTVPFAAYLNENSRLHLVIANISRALSTLSDVWGTDTHGGQIKISWDKINHEMQSLKKMTKSKVSYLQRKQREALANDKKV